MAYVALYRKWRPKTFDDVVGQKQVSETLKRAIREDKVAHAYLFSGPRGTGKTSMAKILGRAMNCEQGPTDHPCNVCESCKQSLSGQSLDIIEIDAASNRGIDEIRSLREQVNFLPVLGRKKVFIIDEAHMLTNEAWNALLKTIEEPPAHVMFIFATTEVEKLPVTIVSRCQRYAFRRITAKDIADHLLYIAKESKIDLSESAAQLIAVHADGGLRDALSILDQCSGMGDGPITPELVEDMMGLVSKAWLYELVGHIVRGEGALILESIAGALEAGSDSKQIVESLVGYLRSIMVAKVSPEAEDLMVYDSFRSDFIAQAESFAMEDINGYMVSLQTILQDMKRVENPRIILEMGLLSLMMNRHRQGGDIGTRVEQLEVDVSRQYDESLNRLSRLEREIAERPMATYVPQFVTTPSPPVQPAAIMPNQEKVEPLTMPSKLQATVDEVDVIPMPEEDDESVIAPSAMDDLVDESKSNVSTNESLPSVVDTSTSPSTGTSRRRRKILTHRDEVASSQTPLVEVSPSPVVEPAAKVISSSEYGTILQNMIKWFTAKRANMLANFYKSGQLIYGDERLFVFEFPNPALASMMNRPEQADKTKEFILTQLGFSVAIKNYGRHSAEAVSYRESAQLAGLVKPIEHPMKEVQETVNPISELSMTEKVEDTDVVASVETTPVETAEIDRVHPEVIETAYPDSVASETQNMAEESTVQKPVAEAIDAGTDTFIKPSVGAGSRPTDVTGFVDDFTVVYPDGEYPYDVLDEDRPLRVPSGAVRWRKNQATDEENAHPMLVDALSYLEEQGYDIYVEDIEDHKED